MHDLALLTPHAMSAQAAQQAQQTKNANVTSDGTPVAPKQPVPLGLTFLSKETKKVAVEVEVEPKQSLIPWNKSNNMKSLARPPTTSSISAPLAVGIHGSTGSHQYHMRKVYSTSALPAGLGVGGGAGAGAVVTSQAMAHTYHFTGTTNDYTGNAFLTQSQSNPALHATTTTNMHLTTTTRPTSPTQTTPAIHTSPTIGALPPRPNTAPTAVLLHCPETLVSSIPIPQTLTTTTKKTREELLTIQAKLLEESRTKDYGLPKDVLEDIFDNSNVKIGIKFLKSVAKKHGTVLPVTETAVAANNMPFITKTKHASELNKEDIQYQQKQLLAAKLQRQQLQGRPNSARSARSVASGDGSGVYTVHGTSTSSSHPKKKGSAHGGGSGVAEVSKSGTYALAGYEDLKISKRR
jgi:hypothetical protein